MFNRNSWRIASDNGNSGSKDSNYAAVKITTQNDFNKAFNNYTQIQVIGTLNEPMSLSFDSEWTNMESIDVPYVKEAVDLLNEATNAEAFANAQSQLVGGGEVGSVWKNKQVWKKSGYLKLNIKMEIVDWHGTGIPLAAATGMIKMCTPNIDYSSNTLLKYPLEGISIYTDTLGNGLNNLKVAGSDIGKAKVNYEADNDYGIMKAGPVPVSIEIGQYFNHTDMVIKNVTVDFSKDVSEMGPLSAIITFQAESRKIINGMNDVGFKSSTYENGTLKYGGDGYTSNSRSQVTFATIK